MEKQSQYVQMESGERALLAMMEKSLFGGECALSEEEQLAALEESRKQAVFCLAAQSASDGRGLRPDQKAVAFRDPEKYGYPAAAPISP